MLPLSAASSRIILKDTDTWNSWLLYIKAIAIAYEVWDQCDPTLKEEKRPKLEKPEEIISIEEAMKEYPENWFYVRQSLRSDWDTKHKAYLSKIKGLLIVASAIRQSIDDSYRPLIDDLETPLELMLDLHKRFTPESDPTYKARLRQQWRNLDRGLDRHTDIDKWLLEWQTI
ncbi:hypothetical protein PENPOL_c014G07268 [Penicillium polonicum]|uniref:DUF4219 domain-containing protein n=1 Tax=Penicillium polonicum TaxID=60169 RepID=A0A1V6NBB6_PENPO|nr:hypothetical protein PENPOL_c014G07268 [Penicillium polonicum]